MDGVTSTFAQQTLCSPAASMQDLWRAESGERKEWRPGGFLPQARWGEAGRLPWQQVDMSSCWRVSWDPRDTSEKRSLLFLKKFILWLGDSSFNWNYTNKSKVHYGFLGSHRDTWGVPGTRLLLRTGAAQTSCTLWKWGIWTVREKAFSRVVEGSGGLCMFLFSTLCSALNGRAFENGYPTLRVKVKLYIGW